MINGKRLSATRDTAKECEQWAASKLLEHKAGHNDEVVESSITVTLTLLELLKLYHENIGKYKRSQSDKFTRRILLRDYPELSQKQIHQITPKDLTLWRNSRLQSVKPSTVKREISYLSAVFSYAVKELFILTINPFSQVSKPTSSKPRNRRVTDNDIRLLKQAVDWTGTKPSKEKPPSPTKHMNRNAGKTLGILPQPTAFPTSSNVSPLTGLPKPPPTQKQQSKSSDKGKNQSKTPTSTAPKTPVGWERSVENGKQSLDKVLKYFNIR
ncbi:hypothetical protein D6D69_05610 [Moraxella catarrhalis]|nr:hypothetical protein D6D69_05610 [Moraxella catarrhalis]